MELGLGWRPLASLNGEGWILRNKGKCRSAAEMWEGRPPGASLTLIRAEHDEWPSREVPLLGGWLLKLDTYRAILSFTWSQSSWP